MPSWLISSLNSLATCKNSGDHRVRPFSTSSSRSCWHWRLQSFLRSHCMYRRNSFLFARCPPLHAQKKAQSVLHLIRWQYHLQERLSLSLLPRLRLRIVHLQQMLLRASLAAEWCAPKSPAVKISARFPQMVVFVKRNRRNFAWMKSDVIMSWSSAVRSGLSLSRFAPGDGNIILYNVKPTTCLTSRRELRAHPTSIMYVSVLRFSVALSDNVLINSLSLCYTRRSFSRHVCPLKQRR